MTVLHLFWMPILLSAVFVFIASTIIHMALPWWHKNDYGKLPREAEVLDALRPFAIPPGDYMAPQAADMADMRTPEFKEKANKGPIVVMTVFPNGTLFAMGKSLSLWFLYLLVVSLLTGYVACHAIPEWLGYKKVAHIVGVASFLGYAPALWQMSIWYRRSWCTTARSTVDGLIYAGITALTFGWLWPR
jgi:hypothetical protein